MSRSPAVLAAGLGPKVLMHPVLRPMNRNPVGTKRRWGGKTEWAPQKRFKDIRGGGEAAHKASSSPVTRLRKRNRGADDKVSETGLFVSSSPSKRSRTVPRTARKRRIATRDGFMAKRRRADRARDVCLAVVPASQAGAFSLPSYSSKLLLRDLRVAEGLPCRVGCGTSVNYADTCLIHKAYKVPKKCRSLVVYRPREDILGIGKALGSDVCVIGDGSDEELECDDGLAFQGYAGDERGQCAQEMDCGD